MDTLAASLNKTNVARKWHYVYKICFTIFDTGSHLPAHSFSSSFLFMARLISVYGSPFMTHLNYVVPIIYLFIFMLPLLSPTQGGLQFKATSQYKNKTLDRKKTIHKIEAKHFKV